MTSDIAPSLNSSSSDRDTQADRDAQGSKSSWPEWSPDSMAKTALPQEMEKQKVSAWFSSLRDDIVSEFEAIERDYATYHKKADLSQFERTHWQRDGGGGGEMSLMRGHVFEKVGVNVSTVHGEFNPEFCAKIPGASEDPRFWASGLSLVAHMHSPLIPAVHMNTRMIVTTKNWFGGGSDLNPAYPNARETAAFHEAFKRACDNANPAYYPRFKAWCDKYFFITHRNEPRGVGGIFFDYLNSGDFDADFACVRNVGRAFIDAWVPIVRANMYRQWTSEQREHLLVRRGRYVEFNLVQDRGTLFGLKTGGNIEAILMSLPPEVKWP